MRLFGLVSLFVLAAVLTLAGPAAAQTYDCSKQESVAVSDQYCATSPTGPEGEDSPPRPPLEEALPPSIVKQLKEAGKAGEALLDLERIAPAAIVRAQSGGRMKKVVDAEKLLAIGALGTPIEPQSAAKILQDAATLGEGFAKTFRWGLLVMTFVLIGASWLRYRARSSGS